MNEGRIPDCVRSERTDRVAVLTVDNPPVNALSTDVLAGLSRELETALADPSIAGIVLTGAGGNFVAGADVSRLEKIAAGAPLEDPSAASVRLPDLIAKLEQSPKPIVAAIDGFALGGGLELALGCHARIGTERCRVGLPELKLGLIPGAGGTQRLPRVAGVAAAMEMMLTSRHVRGVEARELGILDQLAPAEDLKSSACALALRMVSGEHPMRATLSRSDRLGSDDAEALAEARRLAAQRHRNVTFADACLQAVAHGLEHGAASGLDRERELFRAALRTEAARGLIHLFFAERAAARVAGVTDAGLEPKLPSHVAVVGGGTMGAGIATALVVAGVGVQLVEAGGEQAEAAVSRVRKLVSRSVEKGQLSAAHAEGRLADLKPRVGLDGLDDVDFVIEAATENVELKRKLFAELARVTPPTTWLATNTSTIDVSVVAEAAGCPQRVLGTHFFSPAHIMRLVEVVRTADTSAQALVDTLALCKKLKKAPVVVGSCPGFLVNRVFMPYSQLTGFLIDRGVAPYRIDRALYDFGMPMGPCRMSDLAGIDVGVAAGGILDAAYPDRAYRSVLRKLLADAGRLGEKTGRGHYLYDKGRASEDPELATFVADARRAAGSPPTVELDDATIVLLLIGAVVNEACRAIEEGIVLRPSDVDVAATLGMGFPAYRGGPMKWADEVGSSRLHALLSDWHTRFGLGIFEPSALLTERATSGRPLLA